ncbi:carbonic anhydrase [Halobacillus massiliensis]|uniref:carbonic anhydrase n=1 Tax=Halobacillus massiliensis TaxID=1926286 RepID=UPI0009E206D7|nr:carbonic anhydrase family protein [Halobacillus massiliensis]
MSKKLLAYPFLAASISFGLGGCQESSRETGSQEEQEEEGAAWSYDGETGPKNWGELDPEYAACAEGEEQSPINISLSDTNESEEMEDISLNYQPSNFSLANNGHAVQANAKGAVNTMVLGEKEYQLKQFHFHAPSEHLISDQTYDMELHFVHESEDGNSAVIGIMIEEGKENEALSEFWDELPAEETEQNVELEEPIDVEGLIPEDQTTLHYEGSLTTPPCTEEINWALFKEPVQASKEQIEEFKQIHNDTDRPVQPVNEREVIEN